MLLKGELVVRRGGYLIFLIMAMVALTSCSNHEVDTVQEWCEHILGVDLEKKYRKWWVPTPIFSVSFKKEAIRDDITESINSTYMEKAGGRADRMAWREGKILHIVNLSSLFVIDPEEIIEAYSEGIQNAFTHSLDNEADECFYGTILTFFDQVMIHSLEYDALGAMEADNVTVIETRREEYFKPLGNAYSPDE